MGRADLGGRLLLGDEPFLGHPPQHVPLPLLGRAAGWFTGESRMGD